MGKKISANDFINENYTPVHESDDDGYCPRVTIFKAKTMGDLPQQLIDYLVLKGRETNAYMGRRTDWGNCDWGAFDAYFTKKNYYRKGYVAHVKYYVNAIIRHPSTQRQKEIYEKIGRVAHPKRIYHIYDSGKDDKAKT